MRARRAVALHDGEGGGAHRHRHSRPGRGRRIGGCLRALAAPGHAWPDAVIVCLNNCTDDSARIVAAAAEETILLRRRLPLLSRADHRLITGGSGIALGLPANFRKTGLLSGKGSTFTGASGKAAALSGSCSTQSLAQVEAFARRHPVLGLLPDAVMDGSMSVERAFDWAMERIDAMPMVYSSAAPQSVRAMQDKYGRDKVAGAIEHFMGHLAVKLAEAGVTRLVVGGGETSGAVVTALGVSAFAIGPEIDPGVPALAVEGSALRLALKSGNFGGLDFYEKAAAVLAGGAT